MTTSNINNTTIEDTRKELELRKAALQAIQDTWTALHMRNALGACQIDDLVNTLLNLPAVVAYIAPRDTAINTQYTRIRNMKTLTSLLIKEYIDGKNYH
jgi:hypothetical protein